MKQDPTHKKKTFEAADYPALREFLPAYLHQDFGEEYGTAAEAVKGFVGEASGDEILQVKEEWKQFRSAMRQRPLTEVQAALEQLGSAWQPENEEELKGLDEIFSSAQV